MLYFWFGIIATAIFVWILNRKKRKKSVFENGAGPLRTGLIIAHPDDEVRVVFFGFQKDTNKKCSSASQAMFFSPALLHLLEFKHQIFLLCLSNGMLELVYCV